MKLLLLSLLFLAPSGDTKVYICTGPYAKKYHKTKSCSGLRNCSAEIKSINLKDAKSLGKTPCKRCYKQYAMTSHRMSSMATINHPSRHQME